ncbi:hypothetical protein [Chitinophaga dinghuensis]|uniref:hypothetical protein n=1 Tax=Chitinophaga dinghuensis TaxID=1539050 RepID=UPI000DB9003A|nr:hypothetical protein [Chitinophaga dinghuensis]
MFVFRGIVRCNAVPWRVWSYDEPLLIRLIFISLKIFLKKISFAFGGFKIIPIFATPSENNYEGKQGEVPEWPKGTVC